MMLSVTPIYAVLLTVVFLALSLRVIIERRTQRFAYGNNDSHRIEAKIRAQANWAEYAPIGIILLLMAEMQGIGAGWLHLTGALLLIGRAVHGYGMSVKPKDFRFRVYGMYLTVIAIALAMILNLLALF